MPAGTEAWKWLLISLGLPRFRIDIRERDLPQETGQQHALHFTKGCYVGQEIVERIRSRGNVHRIFAGFRVQGAAPEPGTKIQWGDKEVGEITSAAAIPALAAEDSALGDASCSVVQREPSRFPIAGASSIQRPFAMLSGDRSA